MSKKVGWKRTHVTLDFRPARQPDMFDLENLVMRLQDPKVNPKPQDHVTFRIAVNPKAAKAAEKVGGAAAQHAGVHLPE